MSPGYTGMSPAAAAAAAGPTGGLVYPPGYTPPSAADMQRYMAVFGSTDGDRDGFVKGSECFAVFMQSGLDKGLLKRMWDLVARNAAEVSGGGGRRASAYPYIPQEVWCSATSL